jgi:hypothetical protein
MGRLVALSVLPSFPCKIRFSLSFAAQMLMWLYHHLLTVTICGYHCGENEDCCLNWYKFTNNSEVRTASIIRAMASVLPPSIALMMR